MSDESSDTEAEVTLAAESVAAIGSTLASNLVSSRQHYVESFNGKKDADPLKFLRQFNRVAKALKWDDDASKLAKFPNYLTEEADNWYYAYVDCLQKNIDIPNTPQPPNTFADLKDKFLKYFIRDDYKSHLMQVIRARKQKKNEPVRSYITDIMAMCHDLDDTIDDQIIFDYIYERMEREIRKQVMFLAPNILTDFLAKARNCERTLESELKLNASTKNKVASVTEDPAVLAQILSAIKDLKNFSTRPNSGINSYKN